MAGYKSIPVSETLYSLLEHMRDSMHFKSFDELLSSLISRSRRRSMFGSAKWLKGFERDEEDRVF